MKELKYYEYKAQLGDIEDKICAIEERIINSIYNKGDISDLLDEVNNLADQKRLLEKEVLEYEIRDLKQTVNSPSFIGLPGNKRKYLEKKLSKKEKDLLDINETISERFEEIKKDTGEFQMRLAYRMLDLFDAQILLEDMNLKLESSEKIDLQKKVVDKMSEEIFADRDRLARKKIAMYKQEEELNKSEIKVLKDVNMRLISQEESIREAIAEINSHRPKERQ